MCVWKWDLIQTSPELGPFLNDFDIVWSSKSVHHTTGLLGWASPVTLITKLYCWLYYTGKEPLYVPSTSALLRLEERAGWKATVGRQKLHFEVVRSFTSVEFHCAMCGHSSKHRSPHFCVSFFPPFKNKRLLLQTFCLPLICKGPFLRGAASHAGLMNHFWSKKIPKRSNN